MFRPAWGTARDLTSGSDSSIVHSCLKQAGWLAGWLGLRLMIMAGEKSFHLQILKRGSFHVQSWTMSARHASFDSAIEDMRIALAYQNDKFSR